MPITGRSKRLSGLAITHVKLKSYSLMAARDRVARSPSMRGSVKAMAEGSVGRPLLYAWSGKASPILFANGLKMRSRNSKRNTVFHDIR